MATLTKKGLLTPITEEKICSQCIHVINYGWHAVKAECEITHQSWYNYTGENMNRRNAEHCENFCPREEKKIIIEATFNLMYKGQPRFSWRVLYNLTQHKGCYYTIDSVKSKEDYDSFEEALSEGIKEAIKILKK